MPTRPTRSRNVEVTFVHVPLRKERLRYFKYQDLETAGVLTVNEAAHVLQVGRTRMYDLIHCGEIQILPFGRPIRISARWLKSYIDGTLAEHDQVRTA